MFKKEVEAGIFYAGNTAAGVDKTPPFIFKKSWPVYQEEIMQLFQFCLDERYHSKIFKTAILCTLPKPHKQARALPRFYRLIALLSCLKVREQIVSKRWGHIALKHGFISQLHFGAITGRLAIDAAAILRHDIEKAFQNQEIYIALAFDIKRTFDRVLEAWLTKRLWKQNILITLIRRITSFLKERTSAIQLDGQTRKQEVIEIGVSLGSLVATIWFMLFTAPLFKLFHIRNKQLILTIRGYVDDKLLTTRAQKEELGTKMIKSAFPKVEK